VVEGWGLRRVDVVLGRFVPRVYYITRESFCRVVTRLGGCWSERNDDHIRTKSSISSYQCARRPRTEHISGSSKDSSDDNDQRVEGGVALGVLVDGRSGLSSVGSGGETSGLGLSRARKKK
jgi:hypothetical protein